ncbi:MAG: bifunctional diguanylate cyclase/phosphodiesterase, partial [Microthrixaceae bacterium]|nr:bifunctional diguanylate cyclase/phosphodiesterase [Microthrixaceae bacterium]
ALRAADTRRAGSRCALLILDLDGFKNTNDTLGHLVGDQLLRDVSQRLAGTLHPGETLLRLGGDEFAAVLPDVPATPAVPAAAGRLLAALEAPFEVGPRSERLQASVGVATTDESCELEVLLRHADIALYEAKRVGGSAALAFEPEMEIRATASNVISRALAEADYDVEFHLAYQPVVEAHGGRTVSLEALLRWTSPSLGVVGPNEFIPVAEQTGDIREIGRWVIGAACAQLARWDAEGGAPDLAVSVNVSPRQLSDDYFVTETLAIAASQGIDPGRLIIEVTESAVLTAGGEAVEHLEELRSSGVRIAIDDFGTGFSNLGQLLLMPLDIIKVDRSLMLTLGSMQRRPELDSEAPCEVMSAIVSIANARGAPVICEGVETEEQAESLRSSGIQFLQGYLMGRPQPAEALTGLAGVRPRVGSGGPPEA